MTTCEPSPASDFSLTSADCPPWWSEAPPCQDVSRANNAKAKGVDGERSGLYFDFIRIVGEVSPDWYAAENSDLVKTRGYDRLHVALERVGFTCWPTVVGAREAGFFHLRKRSWLAGVRLCDAVAWPNAADAGGAEQSVRRLVACAREAELAGSRRGRLPRPASDADQRAGRRGLRQRIAKADDDDQGQAAANACADLELQPGGPDGKIGRRPGHGSDGHSASDAFGHPSGPGVHGGGREVGPGGDEEALPAGLAAIERVAQALGLGGRSRLAEHYRMADGVRSGLARLCISAYGDAVVTDIAETFGRVMPQLVAELREARL
ncbi:MAG: DNA cytosine methyltransferase [Alphaproteobacteria bacterium]|nr:DNA cytosine methyltransferase [Alphaproteobacteria bacterium]